MHEQTQTKFCPYGEKLTRRTFMRGMVAAAAISALGMSGCAPSNNPQQVALLNGTYKGSAQGRNGDIEVEMTFVDGVIEAASVVDHSETPRISDAAIETIPQKVVDTQSIDVDGVTGATLSSEGVIAALKDCVKQAGGDERSFEPLSDTAAPENRSINCDVLVIGAGIAGMTAGIAAADQGLGDVLIVEKTSNMGGNALVSGGLLWYVNAPDELRQEMTDELRAYFENNMKLAAEAGYDQEFLEELQGEWDSYYASGTTKVFDSGNNVALDMMRSHSYPAEALPAMVDYGHMIKECDDWLNELGFEWKPLVNAGGYIWPRWSGASEGLCGQGYFDFFEKLLAERDLPLEILTCTKVSDLVMDKGVVTGAEAADDDGNTYQIQASKAVILACGGCSNNSDMIKEYNEFWDFSGVDTILTDNTSGATGDGFVLGMSAGGHVVELGTHQMLPFVNPSTGKFDGSVGDTANGLIVNHLGKRYVNETLDRYSLTAAMMEQPEGTAFLLSDANSCGISDGKSVYGISEDFLIDNGRLYRADTIEELATLMGIDSATLVETVDAYNDLVDGKAEDEFGRLVFSSEGKPGYVKEPPFYANPIGWSAHITTGGLDVDASLRVLDDTGEPILGLYAVGETANGFTGIEGLGSSLRAISHIANA